MQGNNKITKKKLFITFSVVTVFFIILLVWLGVYLNNSQYEMVFNQLPSDENLIINNIKEELIIQNNEVIVKIGDDDLSTLLKRRIDNFNLQDDVTIKDIYWISEEKRIYLNTSVKGFSIPISLRVQEKVNDQVIVFNFDDITLGNRNIPVPNFIESFIINIYNFDSKLFEITIEDLNVPDKVSFKNVAFNSKIEIQLEVDKESIINEINEISKNIDEQILDIYIEDKDSLMKQEVIKLLETSTINNEHIQRLLEDITQDKELLKELLVIADKKTIEKIFNNYGDYLNIKEEEIINIKNQRIGEKIGEYSSLILSNLNKLMKKGTYLVHKGKPYNLSKDDVVLIQDVVKAYNLDISEEVYKKMNFLFNEDRFCIAYPISETEFLITDSKSYELLDIDVYYEQYNYKEYGNVEYVLDENIRLAIEKPIKEFFQVDNIYVRYMKADDLNAFVIASSENDYQRYQVFALQKQDIDWKIIELSIYDLYEFSTKYQDFNVKTVTDMHITDKLYLLTNEDKENLIDYLNYKNIIDGYDASQISYTAYDGQYIYIRLKNGEDYVCSIEYSFFGRIYKREKALKSWSKISELITLQY